MREKSIRLRPNSCSARKARELGFSQGEQNRQLDTQDGITFAKELKTRAAHNMTLNLPISRGAEASKHFGLLDRAHTDSTQRRFSALTQIRRTADKAQQADPFGLVQV